MLKPVILIPALAFLAAGCGSGSPPASPPQSDSDGQEAASIAELGAQLYATNCQVCHGTQSGQDGTAGAPPHNETGHTWHHPDAQLTGWVLKGKITGAMPAFEDKLTEMEVEAILAFIKTWWTAEQRSTQADISVRYQDAIDRQEQGQ